MTNCIFCKIVEGSLPSKKVYEDSEVLAFLPLESVSQGHTLIIPKKHFENINDISEEALNKVMNVTRKLAEKFKSEGVGEFNILHASGKNAQQSVFHFHVHLVPRRKGDGLDLWFKKIDPSVK